MSITNAAMKNIIAISALALAVAAPCGTEAQENNARSTVAVAAAEGATQRSEWLPEFTDVKIKAAIAVRFVRVPESEAPRIVYDTKGVADSKFRAAVDNKGMLTVTERISLDRRSRTEVTIYHHALRSIRIADAAATFSEPLKENVVRLHISDGADVKAEFAAYDTEAVLTGRSRLEMSGKVRYLELEASTGTVAADSLEVMSADIEASHGASISLKVTDRLKAGASTSATIKYKGDPVVVKYSSGLIGGHIHRID